MKNKVRCFTYFLIVSFSLSSCYTSYYYVVRHAEKEAAPANNPPLTPAGTQRAIALRDSLLDKKVTRIFVSQYLRTQQTAQPTADFTQLTPTRYDAAAGMGILATELKAASGANVLVVGHSNTIPELIQLLTGTTVAPIADNDFDNFFVIKRVKNLRDDQFSLFRSGTFGIPSP